MLYSPFSTRKPRQFDYKPRHYDPDKEAWEQRKREVLGEPKISEGGEEAYKPGQYIQELRFRRGIIADRQRKSKRPGIIRLAILIVLAFLLVWYIFLR